MFEEILKTNVFEKRPEHDTVLTTLEMLKFYVGSEMCSPVHNNIQLRNFSYIAGSKKNGDITVECSNSHSLPACQWQQKSSLGQFKDISASNKYQNHSKLRMTIKSFSSADRGTYRCKCYDKSRDYKYSSSMTIGKFMYHCFQLLNILS